jgi:hypothetical protein
MKLCRNECFDRGLEAQGFNMRDEARSKMRWGAGASIAHEIRHELISAGKDARPRDPPKGGAAPGRSSRGRRKECARLKLLKCDK